MGLTPTQRGWPISKQTAATSQASLLQSGLKKTFKNVKLKKIPIFCMYGHFIKKNPKISEEYSTVHVSTRRIDSNPL